MLDENGEVCFAIKAPNEAITLFRFGVDDQDENGFVIISLYPSNTEILVPGEYSYEIEFRFSDENVVTALVGKIEVRADMITPEVRR